MVSEREQRRVERLLDQIDAAEASGDWETARLLSQDVLDIDADNQEAASYLQAANRRLEPAGSAISSQATNEEEPTSEPQTLTSFADGRHMVKSFLGEGGKKRVYLAHDELLDRDVAFALIKTDGLDAISRTRISREAQAMGRLGSHPHVVTVFDLGEHPSPATGGLDQATSQLFMVTELMDGGDMKDWLEDAEAGKLPLEKTIAIAVETCPGLEFAHSKGIVHRDLKPGNVWLTEYGTGKIGDFGLSVATDRSRPTQEGMMVWTLSYMPLEQAMGGDVTRKADLYSLGAMLYEMVCGRPPFLGDDSVAIIGQHINTPPVAPTWHNDQCPTALESLIMRLLEKDPTRRPESATHVVQTLESIDLAETLELAQPSIESPAQPQGQNPIYRHTFVGREAEVKQLHAAFDSTLSGKGSLVMVVGEPGIGKTTICEQLAT